MKFLVLMLLTMGPAMAFASAQSDFDKLDADMKTCMDANESTVGMKECMGTASDGADQILNAVYGKIETGLKKVTGDADTDKMNAEILKRLIDSERAWVNYRRAESLLQGTSDLGGTAESLDIVGSVYDMTKARAIELDKLLGSSDQTNQ